MAPESNPEPPDATPGDKLLASIRAKLAVGVEQPRQSLPPSKPLQVFLLIALLITGAAYTVNEWTQFASTDVHIKHPSKLRNLVEAQTKFLAETALGHDAEARKKYAEAILHFELALKAEPNAEGRLNLGNALLKQGNPDMAFSQFKDAIRLDPSMEAVYVAWGQALKFQGKPDDAIQVYQDALRHNSNFAQVHYNFGLTLEQKEDAALTAQHAEEFAHQTEAAKDGAEAQLFGLDAIKQFAAAERLGLNTAGFWCDYGALLNHEGQYAMAETCLTKSVAQEPNSGMAQFQLAVAQDHQGKYADAVGHYEATLTALPDDTATLNNLALLYATATNDQIRSSKMAVLLATRACDATSSQNPRYMDTLARAYASDGDFFQAIAWEDKAVRRATQLADHALLREFEPRFNLFVQHKVE